MATAPENVYPSEIFQLWGDDPIKETTAEVFFYLLLPIGSLPFMREFGTTAVSDENSSGDDLTMIAAALSAVDSLNAMSSLAAEARKVFIDSSMVDESVSVDGDGDIFVTYIRKVDLQPVELEI